MVIGMRIRAGSPTFVIGMEAIIKAVKKISATVLPDTVFPARRPAPDIEILASHAPRVLMAWENM